MSWGAFAAIPHHISPPRTEMVMTKIPETISLLEAARIVTLPIGIVVRDLKAVCATGIEPVSTTRLMRHYKIPRALFEKLIDGSDKLISRAEAAALLGVKKYCLQRSNANRPAVFPVATVGKSPWGGPRYSQWAVQAQIAMDKIAPPHGSPRSGPRPAQPVSKSLQSEEAVPA